MAWVSAAALCFALAPACGATSATTSDPAPGAPPASEAMDDAPETGDETGDDEGDRMTEETKNTDDDGRESALPDFDARWNYGDPAATEAEFRGLLEAHPEARPGWRHELETQIVRTHSLRGEFAEAHALLDDLQPRLGDDARARVRFALERGRTYNSAGEKAKARVEFDRAVALADEAGEVALAIDAVHMQAIAATDADEALALNLDALARAQEGAEQGIERAERWLASLHNNIGWTYHDKGDHDAALEHFEAALAERERRADDAADPGVLIARWSVARAWRSLGRHEEALAEQEAILALYGGEDSSGYTYEEIGENLLALGREEEAAPWLKKAFDTLSADPWMVKNEAERLQRLETLACELAGDVEPE